MCSCECAIIAVICSAFMSILFVSDLDGTYCSKSYCKDAQLKNLKWNLHNKVYGQHFAEDIVMTAITKHSKVTRPEKPLILSFQGPTGTGKNFISTFIADAMKPRGMKSSAVHHFKCPSDFPHKSQASLYKAQLAAWVKGNVSSCPYSIFIFDEIDMMPPNVIDGITPFLGAYDNIGGVDYRKAIFIFLSNTGTRAITDLVLQYKEDGLSRDKITLLELESLLKKSSLNEKGGLHMADIIGRGAKISYYVPMMPLERHHVMHCIQDYIRKTYKRGVTGEDINSLADSMAYWPKGANYFSVTGCKEVPEKVDLLMSRRKIPMKDDL